MQRSFKENHANPVTEMVIVDTFTKLIFNDVAFSSVQLKIIEALRLICPDVHSDSFRVMGEYLRDMGVREMIQLVARLQQHLLEQAEQTEILYSHSSQALVLPAPKGGASNY